MCHNSLQLTFNIFFSNDVKDQIVTQTCKYAEQKITENSEYLQQQKEARGNQWKKKTMKREEIHPLLAIILTMGIVGYPRVRLVIYFTDVLKLAHKIEIIGAQSGHSITKIFLLSCLVDILNSL